MITSIIKCEMKWLNHSQTSTVQMLEFGNGYFFHRPLNCPDSKFHGVNMGPTWVLSAPDGPHVGPMKHCYQGGHVLTCTGINIIKRSSRYKAWVIYNIWVVGMVKRSLDKYHSTKWNTLEIYLPANTSSTVCGGAILTSFNGTSCVVLCRPMAKLRSEWLAVSNDY